MNPMTWAATVAMVVFVGTLAALEAGLRWGWRDRARHADRAHEGIGVVEGSSFALLGLLLALSFAGATSRLEVKRDLIVSEANAIGTAYMRVDLLPPETQPALRALYRRVIDARLRGYEHHDDDGRQTGDLAALNALEQEIWTRSLAALASDRTMTSQVLPPINAMMDVGTAREAAFRAHLPALIVVLLVGSAILSGLLAGYAMAKRHHRSWFHVSVYAGLLALTVYTVIDLDHPRFGLIRIDAAYQTLIDLRATMGSPETGQ